MTQKNVTWIIFKTNFEFKGIYDFKFSALLSIKLHFDEIDSKLRKFDWFAEIEYERVRSNEKLKHMKTLLLVWISKMESILEMTSMNTNQTLKMVRSIRTTRFEWFNFGTFNFRLNWSILVTEGHILWKSLESRKFRKKSTIFIQKRDKLLQLATTMNCLHIHL